MGVWTAARRARAVVGVSSWQRCATSASGAHNLGGGVRSARGVRKSGMRISPLPTPRKCHKRPGPDAFAVDEAVAMVASTADEDVAKGAPTAD